jgi:hypothetical protein
LALEPLGTAVNRALQLDVDTILTNGDSAERRLAAPAPVDDFIRRQDAKPFASWWTPTSGDTQQILAYSARNQTITAAYATLAEAMGELLWPEGEKKAATWLNFGAFASADVGDALLTSPAPAGSKVMLGEGNGKLFSDLAPVFQGFIQAATTGSPKSLEKYVDSLSADYRAPMSLYAQALTAHGEQKVSLIHQANDLLIVLEQRNAQPYVERALHTAPGKTVETLTRGPGRLFRNRINQAIQSTAMGMMEFHIPGKTYEIGDRVHDWANEPERVEFIREVFDENYRGSRIWGFDKLPSL